MKYLITLLCLGIISQAKAQDSRIDILHTVLTDSVVLKYLSEYASMDDTLLVLKGKEFHYLLDQDLIEVIPQNHGNTPWKGIIKKLRIGTQKSKVKIYFKGQKNFLARITLERFYPGDSWHIKSRMLRLKFKDRKTQPDLFYLSYN